MPEWKHILFEQPAPRIARITLNRPEARNAQNTRLLYELNAAFDEAARDDGIKVIILAANGPHFSAGHDLREPFEEKLAAITSRARVGTWGGPGEAGGADPMLAYEMEVYLGFSERWRNIPKPTMAQVQGRCIAGGLMLIWPCDLIVAAEDAEFQDNTVAMGVAGCEFFAHPWELGIRQAKEFLFTADRISARDAWRLGMVNHVVPTDRLAEAALSLAERIAAKPLSALRMAKQAVNAAQDAQGRVSAFQYAFALHQLAHAHNTLVHGIPVDPSGIAPVLKKGAPGD